MIDEKEPPLYIESHLCTAERAPSTYYHNVWRAALDAHGVAFLVSFWHDAYPLV